MLGSSAVSELPVGAAPLQAAPPGDVDALGIGNARSEATALGIAAAEVTRVGSAYASTATAAAAKLEVLALGTATAASTALGSGSAVVTRSATAFALTFARGFARVDADVDVLRAGFASVGVSASGSVRIDIGTIMAVELTVVIPEYLERSKVLVDVYTAETVVTPDALASSRAPAEATAESEVLPDARASSKVIEELTPL